MATFGLRGRRGIFMPSSFGSGYASHLARGNGGNLRTQADAESFVEDFLGFKTANRLQNHQALASTDPQAFNQRYLTKLDDLKRTVATAFRDKLDNLSLNGDLSSMEIQEIALRHAEQMRDNGLLEIEMEYGAGAIQALGNGLSGGGRGVDNATRRAATGTAPDATESNAAAAIRAI